MPEPPVGKRRPIAAAAVAPRSEFVAAPPQGGGESKM